jgi:hypothetical protein
VSVENGGFDWDIGVLNLGTGRVLSDVHFPIIRPRPLNPTAFFGDVLVAPVFGGTANLNPQDFMAVSLPSPGTSMQLFTLYDRVSGGQIYWQTKDSLGFRKDYLVDGRGTSTQFEVVHHPVNNHLPNRSYFSPFSFSITAMGGNWYDAAVRYRDWALHQPWTQRGPMLQRSDVTPRVTQLKLHALQYPNHVLDDQDFTILFDDFSLLVADAVRVKNHLLLDEEEMVLMWADWHAKLFNVELPDLLPARSSVEPAVAAAHAAGILVLPYTNVQVWSQESDSFSEFNIIDAAWTLQDGTIPQVLVGPRGDLLIFPHIRPDPAFSETRSARVGIISDVLDSLQTERWDGIYLDAWSNDVPQLDYNPNLFFKGGTPFWNLGHRQDGQNLRNLVRSDDPSNLLTSELPVENILDKVDLMFYDPNAFLPLAIVQLPVWETVYHGYVLTSHLGSTVPQPSPGLIAFELQTLSYEYHLGKLMGVSNFFADSLPLIDPNPAVNQGIVVFDYLRNLVGMEDEARKYRLFGERLRPLSSSISVSLEQTFTFPTAATSIWRAADGDVGIFATNHGGAPAVITVSVDFETYGLNGTYDLFLNVGGTRVLAGQFSDDFSIPVPVGPLGALLLELVAAP